MRNLLNDDAKFPTLAEQDRLDREAMAELPPVTDSLVWEGMETDDDGMADWLEFTFDPDDQYGTERY